MTYPTDHDHRPGPSLWAIVLALAFAITAGNLACTNNIKSVDRSDETDGAT